LEQIGDELYACNTSSIDPINDGSCITYDEDWQNILYTNGSNQGVWIYGNCSYVTENPGVSIDFIGGK